MIPCPQSVCLAAAAVSKQQKPQQISSSLLPLYVTPKVRYAELKAVLYRLLLAYPEVRVKL